ncbi:MAG: hypothetical protein Crog4KO_16390 [Crocinitomicaceae bacterium]
MRPLQIILLFTLSIPLIPNSSLAQDTLVLQPGAECGEDAYIWELSNQNGTYGTTEINNYGSSASFLAHEWTWIGDPGRRHSLLNFNFSLIPAGATILDARLDLYGFPNSPDNGHSSASGSNESVIQRVTSFWEENTVTWNTQPSTTAVNEVILAQSLNDYQDYTNIDVTAMMQDMVNDPANSFGFRLSMITAAYYRSLIFASSDHPDPNKHPRLTIVYDTNNPNPVISTNNLPDTVICDGDNITYSAFEPCATYEWSTGEITPQITISDAGTYWVEVTNPTGVYLDSFNVILLDCGGPTNPGTVTTEYALVLPNVFTPNGDNINDIFAPIKSEGIASMQTTILNRWGNTIATSTDLNINWNGKNANNQPISAGVYFWVVEFTALDGTTATMHGNVHLER